MQNSLNALSSIVFARIITTKLGFRLKTKEFCKTFCFAFTLGHLDSLCSAVIHLHRIENQNKKQYKA
jgi:hypothetical protein